MMSAKKSPKAEREVDKDGSGIRAGFYSDIRKGGREACAMQYDVPSTDVQKMALEIGWRFNR